LQSQVGEDPLDHRRRHDGRDDLGACRAWGVEKKIAGTSVPVFGIAKSVADLFRYRRTVGDALAIEGLRQALRRRKATPAEIAREAEAAGVWATMEPYLMALTSDA